MIKNFFLPTLVLLLVSCANIEFILSEDNNDNPFKNNTNLLVKGHNSEKLKERLFSFFGNNKKGDYILIANFSETKKNRLVRKNQVAEKIDYELTVDYDFFDKENSCTILNEKIITKFSFVPKSFGYNFGADRSLEELYVRSIEKNIKKLILTIDEKINCP